MFDSLPTDLQMKIYEMARDLLYKKVVTDVQHKTRDNHPNLYDTVIHELEFRNRMHVWMMLNHANQYYLMELLLRKTSGVDLYDITGFDVYFEIIMNKNKLFEELRNEPSFIEKAAYSHSRVLRVFNTL